MPRRVPALVPIDVGAAAGALSRGERIRVVLGSGSGLPAGTRGTVARLDDPALTQEHVVVDVSGDLLPFAPGEVLVRAPAGWQPPAPEPLPERPRRPRTTAAVRPRPVRPAGPDEQPVAAAPSPATARRRGRPTPLTVTLRYDGAAWSVDAQQGARTVLRQRPVAPATALEIAYLIDDDAVRRIVGDVVEGGREQAAAKAEQARRALADAEAALSAFEPRRVNAAETRTAATRQRDARG